MSGRSDRLSVAIVAPGAMGSALGGALVKKGVEVTTLLEGRSAASRTRAHAAGMIGRSLAEICDCDLLMSVLPPGAAFDFAKAVQPFLVRTRPRLAFLDCNAIAPETAVAIEQIVSQAGVNFIDAAIVGGAGGRGRPPPTIYVCGPHADLSNPLREYGLDLRQLDAPNGSASALKMALAAVSKGLTGVISLASMIADQAGVGEAFVSQLAQSQPGVFGWGQAQIPTLGTKAGRWVEEMQILEHVAENRAGGQAIFGGLGDLFAWASMNWGSSSELTRLAARFSAGAPTTDPSAP